MRWMNLSWKKLLLTGVSVLSLFPAAAMAQDSSGKFVLPRQVRWSGVSLPAGEYSYSVEHHAGDTVLLRSANGKLGVIVMASVITMVNPPERSSLQLQSQDGEWFVASMVLSSAGEELHFATPPRRTEVAQDAKLHPAAAVSQP